jgi:hypothetical protein
VGGGEGKMHPGLSRLVTLVSQQIQNELRIAKFVNAESKPIRVRNREQFKNSLGRKQTLRINAYLLVALLLSYLIISLYNKVFLDFSFIFYGIICIVCINFVGYIVNQLNAIVENLSWFFFIPSQDSSVSRLRNGIFISNGLFLVTLSQNISNEIHNLVPIQGTKPTVTVGLFGVFLTMQFLLYVYEKYQDAEKYRMKPSDDDLSIISYAFSFIINFMMPWLLFTASYINFSDSSAAVIYDFLDFIDLTFSTAFGNPS